MSPAQEVTRWNEKYVIGTPVSVRRDDGTAILTTTRSEAQVLGGHTAVIWLNGIAGCYLLSRVSPVRNK